MLSNNQRAILYKLEDNKSDLSLFDTYLFNAMGLLFEAGGIAFAISNLAEKGELGNYFLASVVYVGGRILSTTSSSIRNKIRRNSELEKIIKNE